MKLLGRTSCACVLIGAMWLGAMVVSAPLALGQAPAPSAQDASSPQGQPARAADPPSVDPVQLQEPEECLRQPQRVGCRTVRIDLILMEGLERTHRKVVERELRFEEGGLASQRQLEESMTRLRNLGIFREVTYELITQRAEGQDVPSMSKYPRRVLKLTFDERWTILPAFKFGQGGGLTQFVVGLYDVNVMGRYLELGAQYDRLGYSDTFYDGGGAANSYVVWFRDPRFLDTFLWVGADFWSVKRMRTLYDDRGQAQGGFLLDRTMFVLRMEQEIDWWLRAGLNLELMGDEFSSQFIPEDRQQLQRDNFGGLPESGTAYIVRLMGKLGRIDQDDYTYDGTLFVQSLAHSDRLWGADLRFTQIESELRWYKTLPWRSNVALRLGAGVSNTTQIQHLFYLGGLDRIRGFVDSRFRGSQYWSANAEWRVAPYVSRWLVLQPTAFIDAGTTADTIRGLGQVQAATAGLGLRIISPKIYRFVMRFDYAFPLVNDVDAAFSFGAQQFF